MISKAEVDNEDFGPVGVTKEYVIRLDVAMDDVAVMDAFKLCQLREGEIGERVYDSRTPELIRNLRVARLIDTWSSG